MQVPLSVLAQGVVSLYLSKESNNQYSEIAINQLRSHQTSFKPILTYWWIFSTPAFRRITLIMMSPWVTNALPQCSIISELNIPT